MLPPLENTFSDANSILEQYISSSETQIQEIGRKISALLYIESRAQRDRDSLWDNWEDEETEGLYKKSLNFLHSHVCFDLLNFLNGEMSFRQLSEKPSHSLPKTREDLIQEGWKKVDIEEAIKYFGFPLLCVSIDSSLRHACILLGEKDGKIIGFDKNGNGKYNFFEYSQEYFADDGYHVHMFKSAQVFQ